MSQSIQVISIEGQELKTLQIDDKLFRRSWIQNIHQLISDIHGQSTERTYQLIDDYLSDTIWIGTLKRCTSEMNAYKNMRQSLYELLHLCSEYEGAVIVS